MPVLCDPNRSRFAVVLEGDKGLEPEPRFWVRALSMAEFDAKRQALGEATDPKQIIELLQSLVVGWENIGQEFAVDRLPDILTRPEILELLSAIFAGNQLSETERKK